MQSTSIEIKCSEGSERCFLTTVAVVSHFVIYICYLVCVVFVDHFLNEVCVCIEELTVAN